MLLQHMRRFVATKSKNEDILHIFPLRFFKAISFERNWMAVSARYAFMRIGIFYGGVGDKILAANSAPNKTLWHSLCNMLPVRIHK
jgi:hypothetical protein